MKLSCDAFYVVRVEDLIRKGEERLTIKTFPCLTGRTSFPKVMAKYIAEQIGKPPIMEAKIKVFSIDLRTRKVRQVEVKYT